MEVLSLQVLEQGGQMTKNIQTTPPHRLNKQVRDQLKRINSSAFVDVMARQFDYDPKYVLMNNVKPLSSSKHI
jgi:hypothetical protein